MSSALGTAAWVVLLGLEVLLELVRPAWALSSLARIVERRSIGRVVLVLLWGWIGWHLFTRFGVA